MVLTCISVMNSTRYPNKRNACRAVGWAIVAIVIWRQTQTGPFSYVIWRQTQTGPSSCTQTWSESSSGCMQQSALRCQRNGSQLESLAQHDLAPEQESPYGKSR